MNTNRPTTALATTQPVPSQRGGVVPSSDGHGSFGWPRRSFWVGVAGGGDGKGQQQAKVANTCPNWQSPSGHSLTQLLQVLRLSLVKVLLD